MSTPETPPDAGATIRAAFEELRLQAERVRLDVGNLERAVAQAIADAGQTQERLSGFAAQMNVIGHDVVNLRTGMLAVLDDLDRLFPIVGPPAAPATKTKAAKP